MLFFNPKSGGGKAERFALAREARARGIEPIELRPGDDLERLVRAAVADGADGLAMAGGDGSQAIVAAVAAEHDLPYACIPAGTRNHFALDLGVDRDDVVGALDAFVDGGERRVDLAEVNGRVFVNNVSLGALRRGGPASEGYRDAKLRTLLDTMPEVLGPEGARPRPALDRAGRPRAPLPARRCSSPTTATGSAARSAPARGRASTTACSASPSLGATARPRAAPPLPQRPWREWTAPTFEVDADHPGAGRDRRRGGAAAPAAALPHPARRAARADRARSIPAPRPRRRCPTASPTSVRALARIATTRPPPHDEGGLMDIFEVETKERLSREEVAARLHALADMLARHNDVEFERGGMRFTVHVPDEVDLKVELEIETDERELEIELNW